MESNVFVSLGTNLGELEKNLEQASTALVSLKDVRVTGCSAAVLTKPVGLKDQPDFLNQVQRLATSLAPDKLLKELLGIENEMGRVRGPHWGPRIIDLDLLFYGNKVRNSKRLVLPHPQIWKRRFFLEMIEQIDGTFLQNWAQNHAGPELSKSGESG